MTMKSDRVDFIRRLFFPRGGTNTPREEVEFVRLIVLWIFAFIHACIPQKGPVSKGQWVWYGTNEGICISWRFIMAFSGYVE